MTGLNDGDKLVFPLLQSALLPFPPLLVPLLLLPFPLGTFEGQLEGESLGTFDGSLGVALGNDMKRSYRKYCVSVNGLGKNNGYSIDLLSFPILFVAIHTYLSIFWQKIIVCIEKIHILRGFYICSNVHKPLFIINIVIVVSNGSIMASVPCHRRRAGRRK